MSRTTGCFDFTGRAVRRAGVGRKQRTHMMPYFSMTLRGGLSIGIFSVRDVSASIICSGITADSMLAGSLRC